MVRPVTTTEAAINIPVRTLNIPLLLVASRLTAGDRPRKRRHNSEQKRFVYLDNDDFFGFSASMTRRVMNPMI
jgi:hypothetical protein